MAQRKLKSKAKLPKSVKTKKGITKGAPATKRANKPVQPKKKGLEESRKLKQVVTRTVNKTVEEDIRTRASAAKNNQKLSQAQKAVAEHHGKTPAAGTSK